MTGARAQMAMLPIALALTVGCGCGSEHRCVDLGERATLEVGGGNVQTGYVEMQDGDEMTFIASPGGLFMVTPSIRAWGVYPGEAGRAGDPGDPEVLIELFLQAELIGGSARAKLGLTVTEEGAQRLGIFTPFRPVLLDTFLDQLVTIHGEITDVCGNTATDELDVVVVR